MPHKGKLHACFDRSCCTDLAIGWFRDFVTSVRRRADRADSNSARLVGQLEIVRRRLGCAAVVCGGCAWLHVRAMRRAAAGGGRVAGEQQAAGGEKERPLSASAEHREPPRRPADERTEQSRLPAALTAAACVCACGVVLRLEGDCCSGRRARSNPLTASEGMCLLVRWNHLHQRIRTPHIIVHSSIHTKGWSVCVHPSQLVHYRRSEHECLL